MFNKIKALPARIWNGPIWILLLCCYSVYLPLVYWAGDFARWALPDSYVARTTLSFILVVGTGFAVFMASLLHKGPQPKRIFKLNAVSLLQQPYSMLIEPYSEKFIFDAVEFEISAHSTTFWIDLEDTDDSSNETYGGSVPCRPKFITTLDNTVQFKEADLIKVVLDNEGQPTVTYCGPSDIIPNISWELSKVISDGK